MIFPGERARPWPAWGQTGQTFVSLLVTLIASVSKLGWVLRRSICSLALVGLAWLVVPTGTALAISAMDFPETPPQVRVLDRADLLSRAAQQELEHRLEDSRRSTSMVT